LAAATRTTAATPLRTTFWLQVNCESDNVVVVVAVAICVICCRWAARVNVFVCRQKKTGSKNKLKGHIRG